MIINNAHSMPVNAGEKAKHSLGNISLVIISIVLLIGHLVHEVPLLPHSVLAISVVIAWRFWGPRSVFLVIIPFSPMLNAVFEFFGFGGDPHPVWQYRASDTSVFALATCLLSARLRSIQIKKHPVDKLFYIYGFIACSVIIWSCISSGITVEKARQLAAAVNGLVVYVMARRLLNTRQSIRTAAILLAASVGIICSIAIFQLGTTPFRIQVTPGSVFDVAERFASYLVIVAPFMIALALLCRGMIRWLYVIVGLSTLVLLAVTASRSAWIGGALALVVLFICVAWKRHWIVGLVAMLALIVSVVCGGLLLERQSTNRASAHPLIRELTTLSPSRFADSFLMSRKRIWQRWIPVILQDTNPILGKPGHGGDKTSIFLNLALDNGLLSASFFFVAVFTIIFTGLIDSYRPNNAIQLGSAVALIGFLVHGIGVGHLVKLPYLPTLWLLIALGPSVCLIEYEKTNKKGQTLVLGIIAIVIFLVTWIFI